MNILANVFPGHPSREVPGRAPGNRRPFPPAALVAFLCLLNSVAMFGQASWFYEHITNHNGPEDWFPAIGVGLVIEMIGVFLAGMAHAALMADQSAGMLRFGSYAVGGLVGALNFEHFAGPGHQANPTAITFGALSAISPWLWAIYSRHINRDRLAELGQVDHRGVKLSTSRKFWHPINSVKVMSWAAWAGETNPDAAVQGWEVAAMLGDPENAPTSGAPAARPSTPAEWVAAADALATAEPQLTRTEIATRLGCSDAWLRKCRKLVAEVAQ